jgi:hypothetical protein
VGSERGLRESQHGVRAPLRLAPEFQELYLVVPEKGPQDTHYQYNGFFYPLADETAFLPWTEAKESTLIYNEKQLKAIEKQIQVWVVDDQNSLNPGHPALASPEPKLVIADYEGREKSGA